jgi:hypothetical protein
MIVIVCLPYTELSPRSCQPLLLSVLLEAKQRRVRASLYFSVLVSAAGNENCCTKVVVHFGGSGSHCLLVQVVTICQEERASMQA